MKNYIIAIIAILFGGFTGLAIGGLILDAADYIRPVDILEYRYVFPLVGAFISLLLSVIFMDD